MNNSDDYRQGLIMGLAMQPLPVVTESAPADTSSGGYTIGYFAFTIGTAAVISRNYMILKEKNNEL